MEYRVLESKSESKSLESKPGLLVGSWASLPSPSCLVPQWIFPKDETGSGERYSFFLCPFLYFCTVILQVWCVTLCIEIPIHINIQRNNDEPGPFNIKKLTLKYTYFKINKKQNKQAIRKSLKLNYKIFDEYMELTRGADFWKLACKQYVFVFSGGGHSF